MNVKRVLQEAEQSLLESGSPSPRLDGEVILCSCLGVERISLYAHGDRVLTENELERFNRDLERRVEGEPVSYIVGGKEFWSLFLAVTKDVLIPRPETETLIEETLDIMSITSGLEVNILEIGTGSGAISIALCRERPDIFIAATDLSIKALYLARLNAFTHGVGDRIFFLCADLFEPLSGKFAIVLSNPPYITEDNWNSLPRGIRDFEPKRALVAGTRGTEFHSMLIQGAASVLVDGGWLIMEIGEGQRMEVEQLLTESNRYDQFRTRMDMAGKERVVAARKRS